MSRILLPLLLLGGLIAANCDTTFVPRAESDPAISLPIDGRQFPRFARAADDDKQEASDGVQTKEGEKQGRSDEGNEAKDQNGVNEDDDDDDDDGDDIVTDLDAEETTTLSPDDSNDEKPPSQASTTSIDLVQRQRQKQRPRPSYARMKSDGMRDDVVQMALLQMLPDPQATSQTLKRSRGTVISVSVQKLRTGSAPKMSLFAVTETADAKSDRQSKCFVYQLTRLTPCLRKEDKKEEVDEGEEQAKESAPSNTLDLDQEGPSVNRLNVTRGAPAKKGSKPKTASGKNSQKKGTKGGNKNNKRGVHSVNKIQISSTKKNDTHTHTHKQSHVHTHAGGENHKVTSVFGTSHKPHDAKKQVPRQN